MDYLNIQPDKLYSLMKIVNTIDINITNKKIKKWFLPLESIGVDITNYCLIINSLDDIQWKNFYIFLYCRWQQCSETMNDSYKLTLTPIPVYNEDLDILASVGSFLNNDIPKIVFFFNTLQLYFFPVIKY